MDNYNYPMGADTSDGFLERRQGGRYEGELRIDGVDISPIEGVYFKERGKNYLWLKRKPLLEYDPDSQTYRQRSREPRWEAYLEKQGNGIAAYKGGFAFLRFKYQIVGIWDVVLGKDRHRLNLYAERLPRNEQTIINNINARNKEKNGRSSI